LLLLLLISSLRLQILGSIQIVFLCFFFPFQVSDLLPPSDLAPMEVRLLHLKRNISRSLPNTRLESKTDSLAYNRASGHLVEFKRALTDQVRKHYCSFVYFRCLCQRLLLKQPGCTNPTNLRFPLISYLSTLQLLLTDPRDHCIHVYSKYIICNDDS
jgi:hypothetical protein